MTEPKQRPDLDPEKPSKMQVLLESPFLLLAAGLIVMFAFYTGWAWIEIFTLPQSKLP